MHREQRRIALVLIIAEGLDDPAINAGALGVHKAAVFRFAHILAGEGMGVEPGELTDLAVLPAPQFLELALLHGGEENSVAADCHAVHRAVKREQHFHGAVRAQQLGEAGLFHGGEIEQLALVLCHGRGASVPAVGGDIAADGIVVVQDLFELAALENVPVILLGAAHLVAEGGGHIQLAAGALDLTDAHLVLGQQFLHLAGEHIQLIQTALVQLHLGVLGAGVPHLLAVRRNSGIAQSKLLTGDTLLLGRSFYYKGRGCPGDRSRSPRHYPRRACSPTLM